MKIITTIKNQNCTPVYIYWRFIGFRLFDNVTKNKLFFFNSSTVHFTGFIFQKVVTTHNSKK